MVVILQPLLDRIVVYQVDQVAELQIKILLEHLQELVINHLSVHHKAKMVEQQEDRLVRIEEVVVEVQLL